MTDEATIYGTDITGPQLRMLERLLRDAGWEAGEREQVWAWAVRYLSKWACSDLISKLKSKDFLLVAEGLSWLREQVGEWAERQEDCPADWEGLR